MRTRGGIETSRRAIGGSWAAALAIAVLMLAIGSLSLQRTHFGEGSETDFTGTYGPEAQRILAGDPLELAYHPPGYPFVLALAYHITGNWLAAGLWISVLASLIVFAASLAVFKPLSGSGAAWGALIACAASTLFLRMAATASSDMFFAAMFFMTLALAIHAMRSPDSRKLWLLCGLAAGFTLLVRTNGIVAAIVLVIPLLARQSHTSRSLKLGLVAAGFAAPIVLWAAYASASGSPLKPQKTHINLAVAAFGVPGSTFDIEQERLAPHFQSTTQVLQHDPVAMSKRLLGRFLQLPRLLARSLTWPPLLVLAIPGVLVLLWRRRSRELAVCIIFVGGLVFLSGIPPFHARLFLVLIPFIGAMAGATFDVIAQRNAPSAVLRSMLAITALVLVVLACAVAYKPALSRLESDLQRELGEVIPQVARLTEVDATIFALKSNIGFETGRRTTIIANVSSWSLFREALCRSLKPGDNAYLYVGSVERDRRPMLLEDLVTPRPEAWLQEIALGTVSNWKLYRIELFKNEVAPDQKCLAAPA